MANRAHENYIRAGAPTATYTTLFQLSLSEMGSIRRRVAENPNTHVEILATLAEDPDSEVRIAVGLNKETPVAVVRKLLFDSNADVRYALAETSYLPEGLLQLLTEDDNCYVAQRARQTLSAQKPAWNYSVVRIYSMTAREHRWVANFGV